MREAWRSLTFHDTNVREDALVRDPIAAAKRSGEALRKVHTGFVDDATPVHSFETLMENLETIAWNRCRIVDSEAAFEKVTMASQ